MPTDQTYRRVVTGTAKCVAPAAVASAVGTLRYNFGFQHLRAAGYFCRNVHKVEEANKGKELGSFFDDILWNFSACIMSCSASLEAYLNEAFDDAKLDDEVVKEIEGQASGTLDRFNTFLQYMHLEVFDKGKAPLQEVSNVVALRNAFVHHRPEWAGRLTPKRHRLENRLPKRKYSSFIGPHGDFITQRCVSFDYSVWALESTHAFLSDFLNRTSSRAGLPALSDLMSETSSRAP